MAAGDVTITCIGISNLSAATLTTITTNVGRNGFVSGALLYFVPCGPQNQQIAIYKAVVA